MTAMLRLANVSRRFGGLIAVNNVSFELRAGEIVGLIGPNGAGKTTLVNLITGVHRAGAGEIWYGERAHRSPAAGSHCPARHCAHVPGRAAVPAHDRAGKRHRRRAVRRRRADHRRGQGKGHGASHVHRAFPPRRAAGIGAHVGEPQAPRTRQEPRHQSAASAAGRGQCRAQCGGDRCRARSDPRHRRARHHHHADRARHEGGAQGDEPGVGAASWRADRRRYARQRHPRSARDRGLSRVPNLPRDTESLAP